MAFRLGKITTDFLRQRSRSSILMSARSEMSLSVDTEGILTLIYDGKIHRSDEPVPLNTWVSIEATPEGVMWMYKGGEFSTNE